MKPITFHVRSDWMGYQLFAGEQMIGIISNAASEETVAALKVQLARPAGAVEAAAETLVPAAMPTGGGELAASAGQTCHVFPKGRWTC